jgi:hypothetical protein
MQLIDVSIVLSSSFSGLLATRGNVVQSFHRDGCASTVCMIGWAVFDALKRRTSSSSELSRRLQRQVGEIVEKQAMGKTVAATDTSQQNTSRGLLQKSRSVPGEGVRTGEQQTDDVVAEHCQSAA